MRASRAASASLALALAFAACAAGAKGRLQTRPTMVELLPGAAATRFIMTNSGDASVGAQVRVFAWSQVNGEDQLVATNELLVSPPIARVEPGVEQVVRIIRQPGHERSSDRPYRLVVEELPGPRKDPANAISVRMRYVMPLFVRAAGASEPQLSCKLAAAAVTCLNQGGRPAQLGRTVLSDSHGHSVELSAGLFGYVLPLAERKWMLPPERLGSLSGALRLDSQVNGQPLDIPITRSN